MSAEMAPKYDGRSNATSTILDKLIILISVADMDLETSMSSVKQRRC